ncbi:MAG TPA: hypothetical protein VGN17_08005 [Bryobacteraceae bacterium]
MRTVVLALAAAGLLPAQIIVHLSPATNRAFETYVRNAESSMEAAEYKPRTTAKSDQVDIAPWDGTGPHDIESGLIHDWVAGTLVRGAKLEKALAVFQNYENYKKIFAPEVVESKLLGHEGPSWRAFLRLKRKSVVTVVLDSEYQVEYKPLSNGRWAILSRSSSIAELQDGKPLPSGTGQGFLWRLNSYWTIEPRPEGLYLECRAVSLSRDIPTGLNWIVKPMVSGVPRDSLQHTLESASKAIR